MLEKTACLIKPDAFEEHSAPDIIRLLLMDGFTIERAGTIRMDQLMVDGFYEEHVGRPYYENLSKFMVSAPVLALVLERDDAIRRLRFLMGPAKIADRVPGQIRFEYGDHKFTERNCIHGSDSPNRATYETMLIERWLA